MSLVKLMKCIMPVALITLTMVSNAMGENRSKTAVNPESLSNTTQFGYSQANIVSANTGLVFVAGQVGMSKDGPNDFRSQVDRAVSNLLAALKASGANAEDLVKITLLVKDHDQEKLKYLVEKRRSVFGASPPASTLIPVPVLYADGVLFEIDATAVFKR